MLTLIAYAMLVVTLLSVIFAFMGKHQLYWVAALSNYIFSFLAGFSIGQLTVGLTFVFMTLAIAHALNWIKNRRHTIMFWLLGIIIGTLLVIFFRARLFLPFWLFLK